MADYNFLDLGGLTVYHNSMKTLLDKKLDIAQTGHGGKIMLVDEDIEVLVPRPISALGLVEDVLVDEESVVTDGVAEIDLTGKQDSLTEDELDVLAGVQFSQTDKNKLQNIEEGAEANVINSISVNGTPLEPDEGEVDITVPEYLTDLNAAGFTYVRSLTGLSPNVKIGGTVPNLTITVDAFELPDEFTSAYTPDPDSAIGDVLTDMDATILEPIIEGAKPTEKDVVIYANNIQAVITEVFYDEFDEPLTYNATVTRVPSEVSFAGITGSPMSNDNLAAALNAKMNTSMNNASLDTANAGLYLYVSSTGAVAYGGIDRIPDADILALFEEEE